MSMLGIYLIWLFSLCLGLTRYFSGAYSLVSCIRLYSCPHHRYVSTLRYHSLSVRSNSVAEEIRCFFPLSIYCSSVFLNVLCVSSMLRNAFKIKFMSAPDWISVRWHFRDSILPHIDNSKLASETSKCKASGKPSTGFPLGWHVQKGYLLVYSHLVGSWRLLVWSGSHVYCFDHENAELSEMLDSRPKSIQFFLDIELSYIHFLLSQILIVWVMSLTFRL